MAAVRGSPAFSKATRATLHRCTSRPFSSTGARQSYEDTVQNLRIGKHTRVIYQGFTGRVATGNAKDSLEYGTNIVGGVTPGKEGEHLGLPLLPDLKKAKEQLKPDATAVFVAAPHCGKAIEDAIEAEIPLIVAVAEHIPLHDILRVTSILNTQSKSRLVGANAPGIIAPIGQCRIGFQPLPTFAPGHVGIVAKSGTLSYEAVASVTRAGLGQSLCIGMGGDIVAGTNLVDALKVFEHDPETKGIILIGELGGRAEVDAAEWIKDYRQRTKNPKPIAAIVGGVYAPPGRIMGHAGAWSARGDPGATEKHKILQNAGVTMVDHPENFGEVMKTLLSESGQDPKEIMKNAAKQERNQQDVSGQQKRGYHTSTKRPLAETQRLARQAVQQKRGMVFKSDQALSVLEPYLSSVENLSISQEEPPAGQGFYVSAAIDRTSRQPALAIAPTTDIKDLRAKPRHFPYNYLQGPSDSILEEAVSHACPSASSSAHPQLKTLLQALATTHRHKEAVTLATTITLTPSTQNPTLNLHLPTLHAQFDPSAPKSASRQLDLATLSQQNPTQNPDELTAEAHGIVLVRLDPDNPAANIGTLVNGAGLAMNTVDALRTSHSGLAANFLDTGGKATSATVKKSFELILRDARVRVIFVNIFGGLTDGGMIAEGILLALREVEMRGVPVVVRIRGTNEEVGQRIIRESGLGLEAFDGFAEAAGRVVEIARERS